MSVEVSDIALPIDLVLHKRYHISEVYYLGHNGIVYFGEDLSNGMNVVIKEFMPYRIANRDLDGKTVVCKSKACLGQFQNARETFLCECKYVYLLRNIKKPYEGCVLKYIESFEENETNYLITERVEGRSLQDYIENGEDFSVRDTMRMLVAIVRRIHKKGVIHCDIKPSNILVREDHKIVLIDFGSACDKKNSGNTVFFVSRGYSAPELYHQEKIDYSVDTYSLGAVLYFMLTDYQLPEPDEYEGEEIPKISELITIPGFLENTILRMLRRDKKKRFKNLFLLQLILNL